MNKWLLGLAAGCLCCSVVAAQGVSRMRPYQAPGFELPDLQGNLQRLEDFKGKYLLVNFWAVWCVPCRAEMPSMQRLSEQAQDQALQVLAIHVGPSQSSARQFAHSLGLTFPILVDEQMNLTDWKVMGLPTTYLLDPEGNVIAKAVGERDWSAPTLLQSLRRYGIELAKGSKPASK